jgi:membrane protease subunit (stomatin/prohibitin family)
VGLRAHGNFSFKVSQPEYFFTNIVGGRNQFSVDDARSVISNRFVQQLTDVLAESEFSYSQIDKNRVELAELLTQEVEKDFTTLGFTLTDFRIEGTDFDAETKTRINRISDATAEAIAAEKVGLSYDRMQQLEALRDAARNESGAAGAGVGIGAGVGLGQAMAGGMLSQAPQAQAAAPAPVADQTERLKKLKSLFDSELISQEEYDKKKAAIIDEL